METFMVLDLGTNEMTIEMEFFIRKSVTLQHMKISNLPF